MGRLENWIAAPRERYVEEDTERLDRILSRIEESRKGEKEGEGVEDSGEFEE